MYLVRETEDLLGHSSTLQALVSIVLPEHDPLEFSTTDFVLLLVLIPPPQVLEHSEYDPHEFHWQSTIWRKKKR